MRIIIQIIAIAILVALVCFAWKHFSLRVQCESTATTFRRKLIEESTSYVQIRVTQKTSEALPLCMKPLKLKMDSTFVTKACDVEDKTQLFRFDEFGRIHLFIDDLLCLVPLGRNKSVQMQKCPRNGSASFVVQQFQPEEKDDLKQNILWKRNPNFEMSSILDGGEVFLSRGNGIYLQEWTLVKTNPPKLENTYIPGLLSVQENGLILSTGLTSRIIARSKEAVVYSNGSRSKTKFHKNPDGAAVFMVKSGKNRGGWIYVSNSEVKNGDGGVGAITFNSNGYVIDYEMILVGTNRNCGGGKTYWNTFVTCEEHKPSGQVYEVNPFMGKQSQRYEPTVIGGSGGNYESFAYDNRDIYNPTFYVTNDDSNGSLVRFTPNKEVVATAEKTGDYSKVLYTMGEINHLQLHPERGRREDTRGTFSWTYSRKIGDNNASKFYKNAEGIDIRNGLLYFTTKKSKSLFILDLDDQTYKRSSTVNGSFDGQPDQVARIIGENNQDDLLYFCEEASNSNGIHARDADGQFYTILTSTIKSETTGIAFSPDNRHMYISLQQKGYIFDIRRLDNLPFGAHAIDIHHHS